MVRTSHWLTASLFLAIVLFVATASDAAPAPPSAVAFLNALAGKEAPCLAQIDASAAPTSSGVKGPISNVIYPDCGVYCSEPACSGARSGDPCNSGQGICIGHNVFCSGEFHRSPCTCD